MKDEELRFWQEIDLHLSELTKQDGWGALIEYAQTQMAKGVRARVLNPPSETYTWEKYLGDAGFLKGIDAVLAVPKIVHEKVQNELERRRA